MLRYPVAPAQLHLLVRHSCAEGRAAAPQGARLASVPQDRRASGRPLPSVGFRVARFAGEAVSLARSSTPRDRLVFVLRRMEAMTVDEIAPTTMEAPDLDSEAVDGARVGPPLTVGLRPTRSWPTSHGASTGGGDDDFRRCRRSRGRSRARRAHRAGPRRREGTLTVRSSIRLSMRSAHASSAATCGDGASSSLWRCLGAISTVCLVARPQSSIPVGHDRGLPPEQPVSVSRIEGGTQLEGGYLFAVGCRGC